MPRPALRGPAIRLETERLLLRELRAGDAEAYAEMCADPEVMRYLSPSGAPLSREDSWRQLAMLAGHWVLRGYGMWAVEERSSGRFVGRVGLHYPEGWPGREVGWALSRQFWGRGLATEAARAAVAYAFEKLGWDRLICVILPGNRRSVAVAQRLGARLDHVAEIHGLPHDIYEIVKAR